MSNCRDFIKHVADEKVKRARTGTEKQKDEGWGRLGSVQSETSVCVRVCFSTVCHPPTI